MFYIDWLIDWLIYWLTADSASHVESEDVIVLGI